MSWTERFSDVSNRFLTFTKTNANKIYISVSHNQKVQAGAEKTKEFYQNHKQICIGAGIIAVGFWIVYRIRRKNRKPKGSVEQKINQKQVKIEKEPVQKQKQEKKKSIIAPPTSKKYMLEDDMQYFADELSTDIMKKQNRNKKKEKNIISQSEEDEKKDRFFFEMYNTYAKEEQQKYK